MKVLHVVPTYLPAVRYGGPIYSVHALCQSLAKAGHQVHVITTSVDGTKDSDVPHGRLVDVDGIQVRYCRSRWLRRLYYSAELAALLDSTVRQFDVVHLHSVFLFPTLAAARAAGRTGVPYVLSPRGMLIRDLIARRSALVKRVWIRLMERNNLERAARVHLTSEEERLALIDLGLDLAPTVTIPNGVDGPVSFLYNDVSADIRRLLTEGFDIFSFGRISWKKGLDRLVRAMVDLPEVNALIAGNDEEGLTTKLRSLAQEIGVSDRVRFLSRQISGADKEALFGAARLFVLPSLSENFGNVVAEAMVRGLPVVVTERVGAADIVRASQGGIISSGEPEALAAAISALLASNTQIAVMQAAGAAYARSHLTWDGIAHRFEELYIEILEERRRKLRYRHSAAALL